MWYGYYICSSQIQCKHDISKISLELLYFCNCRSKGSTSFIVTISYNQSKSSVTLLNSERFCVWVGLKELRKLCYTHYLCVAIILLNTGLDSSTFFTYSFRKLVFRLSAFSVFPAYSVFRFLVFLHKLTTFI